MLYSTFAHHFHVEKKNVHHINMFQKKSSPSFSVKKLRCFFWDGPRFEDKINSDEVREYFETLGLDVWDAWSFFKLLDREPRFFWRIQWEGRVLFWDSC